MGNCDHYAYWNFELFSSKVVKWSRHNLALVVLRILVWAKHLTSALHTNSSWSKESAMRAYFTIKLGKQLAWIHCIYK